MGAKSPKSRRFLGFLPAWLPEVSQTDETGTDDDLHLSAGKLLSGRSFNCGDSLNGSGLNNCVDWSGNNCFDWSGNNCFNSGGWLGGLLGGGLFGRGFLGGLGFALGGAGFAAHSCFNERLFTGDVSFAAAAFDDLVELLAHVGV